MVTYTAYIVIFVCIYITSCILPVELAILITMVTFITEIRCVLCACNQYGVSRARSMS